MNWMWTRACSYTCKANDNWARENGLVCAQLVHSNHEILDLCTVAMTNWLSWQKFALIMSGLTHQALMTLLVLLTLWHCSDCVPVYWQSPCFLQSLQAVPYALLSCSTPDLFSGDILFWVLTRALVYHDWVYSWFSSVLLCEFRVVFKIVHYCFLQSFQFTMLERISFGVSNI
jgi:hypothetical protein